VEPDERDDRAKANQLEAKYHFFVGVLFLNFHDIVSSPLTVLGDGVEPVALNLIKRSAHIFLPSHPLREGITIDGAETTRGKLNLPKWSQHISAFSGTEQTTVRDRLSLNELRRGKVQ